MFLWLETLETQRIAGTVERTIESKQCSSTSIQLVQLPTHSMLVMLVMVRNTGDSEDQYRPMNPGEKEIMRIYEDGIYRATNMIERSRGLWITERMSPLLDPSILTTVETCFTTDGLFLYKS